MILVLWDNKNNWKVAIFSINYFDGILSLKPHAYEIRNRTGVHSEKAQAQEEKGTREKAQEGREVH